MMTTKFDCHDKKINNKIIENNIQTTIIKIDK